MQFGLWIILIGGVFKNLVRKCLSLKVDKNIFYIHIISKLIYFIYYHQFRKVLKVYIFVL